MSPDALKIRELFVAAVGKVPPECWDAFLAEACGDRTELRREVLGLLQAHREAGTFLDQPVAELDAMEAVTFFPVQLASTASISGLEGPDTLIGPYKLLEQIGEGGMGLVFVAEQQQPIKRRVALKIIKPGMDSRQVIARFEAERQALALMDHPHIAKVHDGGTTPEGRPYFVMELVKGTPITDYCDRHRLTNRQRLQLFLDVCHAVQHAHQKGIIHRDLKPSNVLVEAHDVQPVVKVIDFGIAKAIGQQLTDKTLYTAAAQMVGTPLYMSPEQAGLSNLDVDTRSDVYSLGVLLYELLTGTTPFDCEQFKKANYEEIRRIIREDEPRRPSMRLSTLHHSCLATIAEQRGLEPHRLGRSLRGELDWIVMKALEKDRNRRYETASAFAADVRRYLQDQPVQIGPPSAWYRFRKFVRRKRAGLLMGACVFLALAGIAGSVGWSVRDRVAREEKIESDQLLREQALDQTVESTLDQTGSLLEQGNWPEALALVDRAEQLLAAAGRIERPKRLLDLRNDLGMVKRLEKIYREPKPNRRAVVLDVGFEGSTQTHQRQRDSSEEDFFSGREQDRRFVEAFRGFGIDVEALDSGVAAKRIRDTSICPALVQSLDDWAAMRKRARGDQDGLWKKLVEIARQADHDEWRNRCREALLRRDRAALEKLAHSLPIGKVPPATVYVLGHVLKDLGALDKAMTVLREARQHHPEDFWLNEALGSFSKDAVHPPRYDDALRYYTAALVLRPWNMHTHLAVAVILDKKGEIDEAIAEYSKAIELEPKVSQVWMERANAYYRLQRYDKAVADYSKVIELEPNNVIAWNNQGSSHNRLGQYDRGIANLSKAIELYPNNAISWHNRGCSYLGLRQFDKAIAEYSKAIELNPNHVRAWRHRGIVYFELQQYDKAVADLSKSIKLDPQQGIAWHYRASSYIRLRQHDKAVADLNKVIELEPKNAMAWINRGYAYNELRQYDKAIADWNKANELDPKNAPAGYRLGNALLSLGQWGKAADAFAKMTVEWEPKDRFLWYTITAVWLYKGDLLRYRRACREMLARFGKTDDPAVAEQTAKTCLLAPDAVRDLDLVMKLADLAIQKNGSSRWIQFTKALAEYRAGHYPKALEWLQRVSAKGDGDCLDAIALALLAMTRKQLGQVKQARAALKQAQALLADKQPQLDKGQGLNDWHNWLRSMILSREAESLLATEGKNTLSKDSKEPERKK